MTAVIICAQQTTQTDYWNNWRRPIHQYRFLAATANPAVPEARVRDAVLIGKTYPRRFESGSADTVAQEGDNDDGVPLDSDDNRAASTAIDVSV